MDCCGHDKLNEGGPTDHGYSEDMALAWHGLAQPWSSTQRAHAQNDGGIDRPVRVQPRRVNGSSTGLETGGVQHDQGTARRDGEAELAGPFF